MIYLVCKNVQWQTGNNHITSVVKASNCGAINKLFLKSNTI